MARAKSAVVIYHNPARTTSRKVLGMIRDAGVEPRGVSLCRPVERVHEVLPPAR